MLEEAGLLNQERREIPKSPQAPEQKVKRKKTKKPVDISFFFLFFLEEEIF